MILNIYILFSSILSFVQSRSCIFTDEHQTSPLNIFHQVSVLGNCYPCLPSCKQCISITDQTCNSGNCEIGYFYSSSQSKCVRCEALCEQCSSQTECIKCIEGYYYSGEQCKECEDGAAVCTFSSTLMCSDGYYFDTQAYICKKCMSNCGLCQQSAVCLQCNSGYLLSSSGDQCLLCEVEFCTYCLSVSTCNECETGYQLFSNTLCMNYDCSFSNCLECSGSACSLCVESYYLWNGECVFGASLMCGWASNNTDYGSCVSCNDDSELAENTNTFCIPSIPQSDEMQKQFIIYADQVICETPYTSGTAFDSSITISTVIKSSYMMELTGLLVMEENSSIQMNLNFDSTLISSSQTKSAIECDNQQYSSYYTLKAESFWRINTDSTTLSLTISAVQGELSIRELWLRFSLCLTPNCQICSSSLACLSCQDPYLVEEYDCVLECGDGYYKNQYERKCLAFCDDGYYEDDTNMLCEKCPAECSSCAGETTCTSCIEDYYLLENTCSQVCTDPALYPASSGICQPCLNPCSTCQGLGLNCTSCKVGFLYQNYCVSECPAGYYSSVVLGNPSCLQCLSPCLQCQISKDICTVCIQNMTLFESSCISECPDGYFMEEYECMQCVNPCEECASLDNCTKCSYGILLKESGLCLNACPDGYYHDFLNSCCEHCAENCLICSSQSVCLECENGTYLQNSQCVSLCSNGLGQNKICQQCQYPCQLCTQALGCYGCYEGYYLFQKSCLLRCLDGYYANSTTQACEQCPQNCSICSSNIQCLECKANFTLSNQVCSNQCPSNTYLSNSTCLSCSHNCLQCEKSQTYCTQCYNNYLLYQPNNTLTSECVNECPLTYLPDSSNKFCEMCSVDCYGCEGQKDFCISCLPNYYLKADEGKCLMYEQCMNLTGFYPDPTQMKCSQCLSPCQDCSSALFCYLCTNSTYLYNGNCLSTCPDGYYPSNNNCVQCLDRCKGCNDENNCTECNQGYYLHESQCMSTCPSTYYGSSTTGSCESCRYPCLQCKNLLICLSCQTGLTLHNQQCLEGCPEGTYLMNDECVFCPEKCLTCSGNETCFSCEEQYYYYTNNTCLQTCPPTYYEQNLTNKCEPCSPPCVECSNQYKCTNCVEGYLLKDGYCYVSCPLGSYPSSNNSITSSSDLSAYTDFKVDGRSCLDCPHLCSKCTGEQDCSSCVRNAVLLSNESTGKNICLEECPTSMYSLNGQCLGCSSNCLSCSNIRTNCTSCNNSLLQNNKCVQQCQQFYFYDQQTENCLPCQQSCSQCLNQTYCTKCFFSYLNTFTRQCSQQCPSATYKDSETFVCEECEEGCSHCISSLACLTCTEPYVLYNIKCIEYPCPEELYYYEKQNKCLQSCESEDLLTDNDNHLCFSKDDGCSQTLIRKGNLCLSQCAQNQYVNQEGTCVEGSSDHKFMVQAVKGTNYILLYIFFVIDEIQIQEQWADQFNVNVYRTSSVSERRLLEASSVDIELTTDNKKKQNALILKVKFKDEFGPSSLEVVVQTKSPYRSIYHEGIPLQNWRYSTEIQSYFVDNTEDGTISVAIVIITISIIISILSIYFHGKPYLLFQTWEYIQLFYLLYFINIQWPSTIAPFLQSFSIAHIRWWSIRQQKTINLLFSPEKYYLQAQDMMLLPNIASNIVIIAGAGCFLLLCKIVSHCESMIQPIALSIWKYAKYILIIVGFFVYSNIILFSAVNVFYVPTSPLSNPITFSTILSYFVLLATLIILTLLFKMQWDNKNALDDGINPSKKRIIIALPLYRIFRRVALVVSLGVYSQHPAYLVCLALISTAFLFTLIYWYQPFVNEIRYKCTLVEEAILFLFLLFVFVYVLNPAMDPNYCIFLTILAFILIVSTYIYPIYCLYHIRKHNQSPEPIIADIEPIEIQKQERQTPEEETKQEKTIKIQNAIKLSGNTDHEADESSQEGSKKKIQKDEKMKLANKNARVVKQFKNYDIDDKTENDAEPVRQNFEFNKSLPEKKKKGKGSNFSTFKF